MEQRTTLHKNCEIICQIDQVQKAMDTNMHLIFHLPEGPCVFYWNRNTQQHFFSCLTLRPYKAKPAKCELLVTVCDVINDVMTEAVAASEVVPRFPSHCKQMQKWLEHRLQRDVKKGKYHTGKNAASLLPLSLILSVWEKNHHSCPHKGWPSPGNQARSL